MLIDARKNGRMLLNEKLRKSLRSKLVLERIEKIYSESSKSWEHRGALYTPDELHKADSHALLEYTGELRRVMRFK